VLEKQQANLQLFCIEGETSWRRQLQQLTRFKEMYNSNLRTEP